MHPRRLSGWNSEFGSWVSRVGVRRVASALGVTDDAVYNWVAGRRAPQPIFTAKLIRLSRGALTLESIYARRVASVLGNDPKEGRCA